ncbi:helix-turn-helix domain-containing protein [Halomarina salina]|uniref:Helix-turn-helix domain-containing protein n=1 Tax=Halomarina salina TaxID=1872699 RepID=A0ABD5RLP7_9EURY|nr:helix-turn-helix domain-containing protein [Halomarina salina]
MARLEGVPVADLLDALDAATSAKATKRLMVAVLYKRGHSVPVVADWFGMRENTIYAWFDRLEAEPIEQAVRDRPRPGRPPKLDENERRELDATLHEPPTAAGYDADAWSVSLVRRHIAETYDVEYTHRHVRNLVDDAGVSS